MARTKASVGAKLSSGKSSKARCSAAPPSNSSGPSGSGDRSSRNYAGGNSVCPRETPKWQKPITTFFISKDVSQDSNEDDQVEKAGSSKPKSKRNIIESDEEEEVAKPKNSELDETFELEELTGDKSHKIEEYYDKNKGKGVGKKTKGKENKDSNIEKRRSKRDLEDSISEDVEQSKMSGLGDMLELVPKIGGRVSRGYIYNGAGLFRHLPSSEAV